MWVIKDSIKVGQNYILVPNTPDNSPNKGFDLAKVDEYSIQSPSGNTKETFNIDRIVGDTVYVKSTFSYIHPKTTNLQTSHIIVSKSKNAGISASESRDRPALTCGSVTDLSMVVRISHELMHSKGLRDVNDSKNIMHYTISGQSIDNRKPFSYKELDPVITGTSTIDNSKPKQNQWNLINRQ